MISTSMVAGVDEAGRGPLAGPVVAAAVILDPRRPIRGLRDSKQLTAQRRTQLAARIRLRALAYAVAQAEPEEIDRLNILQASLLAMRRALLRLTTRPLSIAIDGPHAPQLEDCFGDCAVRTIIRGDDLLPCISAASILAKTYRDALMGELDRSYPGYGLGIHFGYATRMHLAALVQHGPSPIHRRSFAPVRAALNGLPLAAAFALSREPALTPDLDGLADTG